MPQEMKTEMRKPISRRISIAFTSLIVGGIFGYVFGVSLLPSLKEQENGSVCTNTHSLLYPQLDCPNINAQYQNTSAIEEAVRAYIDEAKVEKHAETVSVFYRSLTTQKWFGINENEQFAPGSLLKLPLGMAYYKLAEISPDVLNRQFQYRPTSASLNKLEHFPPPVTLTSGTQYATDELVRRMIQYSDNETALVLATSIDKNFLDKVFTDVGVTIPVSVSASQQFLTTKVMGAIFRMLYYASYLNPDGSQKILEIMSHSSFTVGLRAGVPSEIAVSNKFGERSITDAKTGQEVSTELHDCGIIYHSDHPYILCIMSRGNNYNSLGSAIADISRIVWEKQK